MSNDDLVTRLRADCAECCSVDDPCDICEVVLQAAARLVKLTAVGNQLAEALSLSDKQMRFIAGGVERPDGRCKCPTCDALAAWAAFSGEPT